MGKGEERSCFRKAQDSIESEGPLYSGSERKLKATTLVPGGPGSSEVIESSDSEPTPSCPAFEAAGARRLLPPGC